MTLPVADAQIAFDTPGDRATVPITFLPVFIPVGGNPDFPSEVTDPAGPQFLAILLPDAGEGLPDDGGETARPGGSPGEFETGSRIKALIEKFRPLVSDLSGGRDAVIAEFSDWFVDKIWIRPVPIAFGNILSPKSVVVAFLNAFRSQVRTLSSIDISALGLGVSITVDPTPLIMQPNQDATATIEAIPNGPPSFDANVDFVFDHRTISIRSTGTRLILFFHQPEQPMQEDLGWFTDILKKRDGNEQRDSLRSTPRQTFRFRIKQDDPDQVALLRNILFIFRPFLFGVPVWHEQRVVTNAVTSGAMVIPVDTTDVDHRVGGSIMVWEPDTLAFFDAVIDSFTSSSITIVTATIVNISKAARVIPIRFGFIDGEPRYNDNIVGIQETIVTFETTDNVDLAFANQAALEVEFPVHPEDSLPVLSDPNMMQSRTQNRTTQMPHTNIDGKIGLRQLVATVPRQDILGRKSAKINSLAEVRKWRSFLHFVRGSFGPFYLPTFRNDVPPKIDFNLNSSTITVFNAKLTSLIGINDPHKSVMLELPDGSQFFAEIASVAEIDDDTETITLVNPFDAAATPVVAATAKISWLELSRIEGDAATFLYNWAGGEGSIRFQTRTIQQ